MCPVWVCGCSWLLTAGLMAERVSEWVSEQLKLTQGVSGQAREANVGVKRGMWGLQLGTIGCIMDGEAEESEREAAAVVWAEMGSAGVWAGPSASPRPQGTLTQRAIDMEALCGLNCGPLAAGARAPATHTKKKHRKRKKIKGKKESHPSIHPLPRPLPASFPRSANRLHSAPHCAALSSWPDHCYSP